MKAQVTALRQYERLESTALWRRPGEKQRREIVVSFGESTLVFSDFAGAPLAHWALPALERLNSHQMPALYSPDGMYEETIEIEDPIMVDAIAKVQRHLRRQTPKPGLVRRSLWLGLFALLTIGLLFWAPTALRAHLMRSLPFEVQKEIGLRLRDEITRYSGPLCDNPLGQSAAQALEEFFLPEAELSLGFAALPQERVIVFPGGVILIDKRYLEKDVADALIARIPHSAEDLRAPLSSLLEEMSLWELLGFAMSFDLPANYIGLQARRIITGPTPDGNAPRSAASEKVIPDEIWVALQGICES